MNKIIRTGILILVASALSACAVQRVATDFDRDARFSQLQSFAWFEPAPDQVEDPMLDSPLLARKIRRAASHELVSRGYTAVPSGADADFLVTYHTTSRERIRDAGGVSFGIGVGGGYRRGHHSIFVGDRFGRVESYQEGTLIIDIINARSRELIWRGWIRDPVRPSRFTDEAIDATVREILAQFPPGS